MRADTYQPSYLPDGTIKVSVAGVTRGLRSFDLCLDPNDMANLIAALGSLGFSKILESMDWPWITTGPVPPEFTSKVPWIQFDPLAQPIQAGQIASYFSHGVSPFVGSQFEKDLRARIASLDLTQAVAV
jgi:hypothetical protein